MTGNAAPLQLFPPPPGKNGRPKRKASRRKGAASPAPMTIREHTKSPSHTESIVIHVSKDTPVSSPLVASPGTRLEELPSRSTTPNRAQPTRSITASPALTNNQSRLSTSETLVRSNSVTSAAAPIQSIFPRYDPSVPLTHQNYRPTQASPTHIPRGIISKDPYSPSLYSPQSPHHPGSPGRGYMSGPATAPSSITTFPSGVLSAAGPRFSSREELAELWEAANGQGKEETGRTFTLKMTREGTVDSLSSTFTPTPSESFSFGPTKDQPFFDLQALKANDFDAEFSEINIRRHDPRKGTVVPVLALNLEPPSRRNAPGDGLVTLIYPKLAAMMALDDARSSSVASPDPTTSSPPSTSPVHDQDTIRNAAAVSKECCKLLFDHDSQRYYLHHPGLSATEPHRFNIVIDNTASASTSSCGFDVPTARSTIRLVDPSSTTTLVALEFGTATLVIDTVATSRIPSLYIVDVAVAAVLTVALVEGRRFRRASIASPTSCLSPQHLGR
ncbi:MAG: hypothetical protein M1833_002142, partial [Piccolia ochrophora]